MGDILVGTELLLVHGMILKGDRSVSEFDVSSVAVLEITAGGCGMWSHLVWYKFTV